MNSEEVCFDGMILSDEEEELFKGVPDYMEEEESSEDKKEEEIANLQARFHPIMKAFPKPPSNITKSEHQLDFYIYYYLKFKIFLYIYGSPESPRPGMSDEALAQTASALHMHYHYKTFISKFKLIQNNIIEKITADVMGKINDNPSHPMAQIIWSITVNKEVHTRRIKASPSKIRNKLSVGEKPDDVYNVVTLEKCYFGDKPSPLKWMIFNPLPSDYDDDAIDPQEGGYAHKIALAADELQHNLDSKYDVEDPFGCVVSPEWEILLSFFHSVVFFNEYVDALLAKKMDSFSGIINKKNSWETTWKKLVTEDYYNKSIKQFSSNNSKPVMVSTICKVRDLVRAIVAFNEQ